MKDIIKFLIVIVVLGLCLGGIYFLKTNKHYTETESFSTTEETKVSAKSDNAIEEETTEVKTQAKTKKPNPTQVKLDYAITLSKTAKFKEVSNNWNKGEKLNSFFKNNKNLKNNNKATYIRLRMMVSIGSGQRSYKDLKGYYLNGLEGTKLNRTQKKVLKDIILKKNNDVKEYMETSGSSFEEALNEF